MKKLVLLFLLMFIVGCEDKNISEKIEMTCNDITTNFEITVGNKILCEDYSFEVKKITKDKIMLKVDKGIDSKEDFELESNNELVVNTDENNTIMFKWKK